MAMSLEDIKRLAVTRIPEEYKKSENSMRQYYDGYVQGFNTVKNSEDWKYSMGKEGKGIPLEDLHDAYIHGYFDGIRNTITLKKAGLL